MDHHFPKIVILLREAPANRALLRMAPADGADVKGPIGPRALLSHCT